MHRKRRFYCNYIFYKLTQQWYELDAIKKELALKDLSQIYKEYELALTINTYSTVGIRKECDFMFWRIADNLEIFEKMSSELSKTLIGKYISCSYSFLSMTKFSQYVKKHEALNRDKRTIKIRPSRKKYLFIYPFVKKAEWYQLELDDRKKMMHEHISAGSLFPSIKINTTYSFGIDDQDQVVGFETNYPEDFLDLVESMRSHKSRIYTERDTPILTCIFKNIEDLVKILN